MFFFCIHIYSTLCARVHDVCVQYMADAVPPPPLLSSVTSDADTVQRDTVRGAAALSRGVVVYRSHDAGTASTRPHASKSATSPFTQIIITFLSPDDI